MMNIDPVDLMLFICARMQTDNNWLVDKLAETEEEKSKIIERSTTIEN
jgi:hypothetical protein